MRELEKHTSKDHADYNQLTKAMATVHSTISAINEDIHIHESRLKVAQVDPNPNTNPNPNPNPYPNPNPKPKPNPNPNPEQGV